MNIGQDLNMTDDMSSNPGNKKNNPDLYKKVIKGGFWVVAIKVCTQLLSIMRYLLLMNVLKVLDIGLLGVAMLLIQTLDTFTTSGFNAALVQKNAKLEPFLNSAWTVGIIRAFIVFGILYFGAPYVVGLKVEPERVSLTISIIRAMGLSFLIGAFGNIGVVYFGKELQFKKLFFLQILPTLVSVVVTVFLVLIYKSVWSLVIGRLSANLCRCIFSYIIHPFRPKIEIDLKKVKELWGFGKWVLGSIILRFFIMQGDDFFVWIYIDTFALALYQAAYKFSNMPATEIAGIISQISFPAYSKLQGDIPRLREAFLKVLKITASLSIPAAGLIFILAPDFVSLFLKERWLPIVPAMQILAFFGLSRSVKGTSTQVYYSVGYPVITTKMNMIKVVVLAILIWPLTRLWGISGTAVAVLIVTLSTIPLDLYYLKKLIQCSPRQLLAAIMPPLFAALIMVGVLALLKQVMFGEIGHVLFFVMGFIGTVTYIAVIFVLDMTFNYGIIQIVKDHFAVVLNSKNTWKK